MMTADSLPMQKLRNQAKQAESIDAKRKHMQAFVDKFRYNAKRASLVQSRLKAIERLGEVQMMVHDPEYVFKFPFPDCSIASNVVSFTDVCFNYPEGPELFKQLNFGIDLQSRAAIIGPNGKSPIRMVFRCACSNPPMFLVCNAVSVVW
jgi:ATP-binding cassette subfamily F protein 3